jgi:hypothetical protein
MTRFVRLGAITLVAALIAVAGLYATTNVEAARTGDKLDRAVFHDTMRKLWEDHVTWTRLYIVSAATVPEALPDLSATAGRLLDNQDDIGDVFRPFYGDAVGDAVTGLLREHILTAATLVDAAKAGDPDAVADASAAWYANADAIAAALSGLDPEHWPLDHMHAMMRAHLDRTLDEAVARLEGRYADDIAAYEAIHADILAMADMLSDGIMARFGSRFRG